MVFAGKTKEGIEMAMSMSKRKTGHDMVTFLDERKKGLRTIVLEDQ